MFSPRMKRAAMATRRTYGRARLWGVGWGHDQFLRLSVDRIRMFTAETVVVSSEHTLILIL